MSLPSACATEHPQQIHHSNACSRELRSVYSLFRVAQRTVLSVCASLPMSWQRIICYGERSSYYIVPTLWNTLPPPPPPKKEEKKKKKKEEEEERFPQSASSFKSAFKTLSLSLSLSLSDEQLGHICFSQCICGACVFHSCKC